MVGSLDERNFHLKVLMAIAQMVEEKGFFTRWFAAEREEQLRDILLLSSRHRELC
jgi:APA family basic amino acid/polyamine antiporter